MRRAGQEMALRALVTARCHCRQPEDRDGCTSPSPLLSLFLPREELVRSCLLQNKDEHSSAENTQHKMFLFLIRK